MVRPRVPGSTAQGFTYLGALFLVALVSGGLAVVGEDWGVAAQRDKEAELLFVGHQYRLAIGRYYRYGPRQYPRSLADLLKDPRRPGTERYLRRLYADPLTAGGEWGLVRAPDGGIQGVYSLSGERPLKTAGFKPRDRELLGAASYTDWKFLHAPQARN
ncbi:MAG TPA: type II secretion system protein [Burkholderiales bacterium]|jgi:type II secretory pathway pseudopilin PulG